MCIRDRLIPLAFHQAAYRDPRPAAYDPRDLFVGDPVTEQGTFLLAFFGDFFLLLQLLCQSGQFAVFQLSLIHI